VLVLRGHGALFARIALLLGVGLIVLAGFGVYGLVQKPGDEISLGVAIAAGLAGPGLLIGALWRLKHPDCFLVIDKKAQTLAVTRFAHEHQPIPFAQLGTMTLGSTGFTAYEPTGERRHIKMDAIRLTNHPEVVLYEPLTSGDMVRFVTALRHVVGEQYLPRAEKKPRPENA